ncbi:hypothetical protein CEXT_85171 [Caerostris extrusa]|uniref:Uncharacterized protein n=1 Tax=Caerostris extrusa TaxID=172846 RepID=A0AAV4TP29_CAEEX|nr:hypothetical protein CEXT_85171 [Caerostris extrusa]
MSNQLPCVILMPVLQFVQKAKEVPFLDIIMKENSFAQHCLKLADSDRRFGSYKEVYQHTLPNYRLLAYEHQNLCDYGALRNNKRSMRRPQCQLLTSKK